MRLFFTIIAVAINILVFLVVMAFMIDTTTKKNSISSVFFVLLEMGAILNTLLVCAAR